jgi:hypothetical protein
LTYQWTKDGLNLADDGRISGSQGQVLTIAAVRDADAGRYWVTVANTVGEMVSLPARLSIEEGVVLINFDDVTSPCSFAETTRLTDLYADLGVTFEGPGGQDGAAIVNECNGLSVTGYSPPNFLAFSSSANLQDGGVPRGPETIRFAAAFSRLDLTVGSPAAGTVTVRAYDAAETMVASATVALTTSMTPVQLRGPNMSKVVVSTTAEAFVLDDLRASGPPEGEPPQIVVQPFSQTAVVGETITFSVVATGADPMSYQWDFDGALVPNATNSALLLPNVSLDDAGRYRVRVSNVYGEAFSDNVTLTVSDPADQFLDVWRASDLTTLRDGDTVYSWTSAGYRTVNAGVGLEPEFKQNITPAGGPVVRFNRDFMSTSTSPLGGATAFSIALVFKADAVGANECADWYCKTGLVDAEEYGVTADWGTVITETGQVGIGTGNPDVSTYSTSSPSLVDGNFHVAVFTWGGGMQSVYVDNLWTSSQSGVSTTYRNNAGFAFGGIFADMGGWANQLFVGDMAEIRFYNRALSAAEVGRVISRLTDDHILVDGPPSFLLEPQNQVALLGGSAVFSVMASGSRPVQYQWDFNGVDIAGATNNTLALHGVTVEHAGWYRVRISNDLGSVISRKASLSIRNEIVLVPFGSVWEYLDTGVNLGTTWVAPGFDDSAWASGRAHLGYGDGDEVTVISYGPNPDSKYVTSYFRLAFVVANPNPITNLRLRLIRDDGAIVYLNGVEVVRDNMPSGQVGYLTVASSAVGGTTESQAFEFSVPANQLVSGTNVLAVEIHQNVANSSDLSFDLALLEGLHVGPLQITTQPQPQTVVEGTNVAFTVSASSAIPIRYQWRFNSSPLTDKTNLTLTLTNVQPEDDGFYDVVVSDDVGSVISDPARLTVLLKPRIIQLVTNYTVVQGGNLTLSVQVEGTLPITYVWRRNFFSIRNRQTNDSHQSFFTLTNVQPSEDRANGTYYSVTIANSLSPHAGLNSDRIYLTVLPDSDGDGMDDGWETRYPTATEPDGDADADGLTNKEEYQSGTDPTDPTSYLKVERIAVSGEAQIEFIARANRTYTVEYTEDLDTPAWHKLSDVVAGLENRTVVLTDPAASAQRFYRLVTPRMSNGT